MLACPLQPRLSQGTRRALVVGPFLLLAAGAAGLANPATRRVMRWVFCEENGPAELLTFVFLFAGGVHGLGLAARARRAGLGVWTAAFYCAFGLGFLLVGMEEIAWGQWFFHWRTPEFWDQLNAQHETTLHNLAAFQGSTETFRIVFAAGGLVGILCGRWPSFAAVAAPAVLGPLFWLIGVHASIDLILDYAAPHGLIEKGFTRTSELVEAYVAFGGWMYIRMNSRRIAPGMSASPSARNAEMGAEERAARPAV